MPSEASSCLIIDESPDFGAGESEGADFGSGSVDGALVPWLACLIWCDEKRWHVGVKRIINLEGLHGRRRGMISCGWRYFRNSEVHIIILIA